MKTSINCDGCANTVREFLSPKCFMFLMKVFNLTDKILMFFFFFKSALARFDHLFLKKPYDQPNLKNFPEINLVTFVLIVVTDLCSRHDSST